MVALSTGEAEMYAINKTAATGMGGNAILNDLGVNLDLRVFTDATTGKSLVTRRGLGKVRHIAVNELWLQSHVQSKALTIVKIKNKFNPSDVLTKHLTRAEVQQIMEFVQHYYEEGRSLAAPKLVAKDKVSAVHVDENDAMNMVSNTSSSIGGISTHGQVQQRCVQQRVDKQLDFYRALTSNLPGFVCAYGGRISPPHLGGVVPLHSKQQ